MILSDFTCPVHGRFEQLADADDDEAKCMTWLTEEETIAAGHKWFGYPTLYCGTWSPWTPTPIRCRVRTAEVERGGVDRPASPMYLDTRELGEGMPYDEWRAKRDKMYEDRRHKESKEL